jgi:hypothetical protein
MTLVVYKNNILAADTRTSTRTLAHHKNHCAHCGGANKPVNDDTNKIMLVRSRDENKKSTFRGDTILAFAGAGNCDLLGRIKRIIRMCWNLEEMYTSYMMIHGSAEEKKHTCTVILICEKKNYVIVLPKVGGLEVTEHTRDEFLAIGSGSHSAKWINNLLPTANAPYIVNMAMYKDTSVGGDIHFADFNTRPLNISTATKQDPKFLIEQASKAFLLGEAEMLKPVQENPAPKTKKKVKKVDQ